MNIAGMVLGIVAVTLAWIPLIGIVSIPLVLVGMPLSIIGLRQRMQKSEGTGIAVAGIATNSVALVFILIYIFLFATGVQADTSATP